MKRLLAVLLSVFFVMSCASCGTVQPSEPVESGEPAETVPMSETGFPSEPETVPGPEESIKPEAEEQNGQEAEPEIHPETETDPEKEAPSGERFELTQVQPIVENGRYVYNPYLLSTECIDTFGEEFCSFYTAFITAYMNHETECPCEMEDYIMYLDMVLNYECSFYVWDDIEFNWVSDYDYDNHVFSWRYHAEKEVIDERITKVSSAMQGYLDLVAEKMPEQDKMQMIYHAFCPQMTYDNDAGETREQVEAYYALCENHGVCVTFSHALSQILNQAGIYATLAAGEADGEAHSWNYVCINGSFYFFDPTYELNYNSGTAFVYYGMTLEERRSAGVESDIMLGRYSDFVLETPESHLNVRMLSS